MALWQRMCQVISVNDVWAILPVGGPLTPMRSVNEGNLATSQDIGHDPGDDAAPQGVPRDSGAHHARPAEPAQDEPRLDPRAVSHHDVIVLE
ncbi:hypothetical protein PI124_g20774 [Phytophthora idaei]|nr:hypothetical protein PI124_g20774 [Phytophthora idaei]